MKFEAFPQQKSLDLQKKSPPTTEAKAATSVSGEATGVPLTSPTGCSLASSVNLRHFPTSPSILVMPQRNFKFSSFCTIASSMSINAHVKTSYSSFLHRKDTPFLHFVRYHSLGNDFVWVTSSFSNFHLSLISLSFCVVSSEWFCRGRTLLFTIPLGDDTFVIRSYCWGRYQESLFLSIEARRCGALVGEWERRKKMGWNFKFDKCKDLKIIIFFT